MKTPGLNLIIVLIIIIMPKFIYADHVTVQGEVSGEWSADTVLVAGDLSIINGQNLVIQPGTHVIFTGSFVFDVDGSLQASGTDKDSIWFSMADTSGFHVDTIPDGGWKGIRFDSNRNTNTASVFYRCSFTYGKNANADPLIGNGGALSVIAYNQVQVNECLFADNFAIYNGGAVALDSADVSITNSVFNRNRAGLTVSPWGYGGAISSDNSNPEIRWNVFTGNYSTGVGGGISVRYKDCNIYNNVFTGNTSGIGGALCLGHIPETVHRVNNNLMDGNQAIYFGGGVATLIANPIYINNTIVNNTAMYGGGFYCKDSISPDFYNTIFWGNQASVGPTGYMFEVYSQADFFNCDVQYGPAEFGGSGGGAFSGTYDQCIELDPKFLDYGEFPYQLDPEFSPCIDAGSQDTSGFFLPEYDLAYLPRVWGGNIEMGAYEYVYEGVDEVLNETGIRVYPNPFTDHFTVEIDLQEYEDIRIEVFDMVGKCIERADYLSVNKGIQQFTFDLNGLQTPDDALVLKVTHSKGCYLKKMIHCVTQRSTK
jgi:hypothetical protein